MHFAGTLTLGCASQRGPVPNPWTHLCSVTAVLSLRLSLCPRLTLLSLSLHRLVLLLLFLFVCFCNATVSALSTLASAETGEAVHVGLWECFFGFLVRIQFLLFFYFLFH